MVEAADELALLLEGPKMGDAERKNTVGDEEEVADESAVHVAPSAIENKTVLRLEAFLVSQVGSESSAHVALSLPVILAVNYN